jgi:hypothetical protein
VPARPHGLCRLRRAVYTRKSSEEGLEQDFNSLRVQREADIGLALIAIGEDKGERPRCAEYVGLRPIAGIPAWRQAGMASANGMPLADVIGAR